MCKTKTTGSAEISQPDLKLFLQNSYSLHGQELETITGIVFRALQRASPKYNTVEEFVNYKMDELKYPQRVQGPLSIFLSNQENVAAS